MTRFRYSVLFVSLGLVGGCVPLQFLDPSAGESATTAVPSNPFGSFSPGAVSQSSYTPATGEWTARVNAVGRTILAANPELGVKPLFGTIASPQPELFHQGTSLICITEGLVKMCKTDSELAALLCLELGRMMSEREARAAPQTRNPEPRPPIEVPIGNAGQVVAPETSRVGELLKYESERKRAAKRVAPPDPVALARTYLGRAGYPATALDGVGPLIDAADRNYAIEKQLKTSNPNGSWSPQ